MVGPVSSSCLPPKDCRAATSHRMVFGIIRGKSRIRTNHEASHTARKSSTLVCQYPTLRPRPAKDGGRQTNPFTWKTPVNQTRRISSTDSEGWNPTPNVL